MRDLSFGWRMFFFIGVWAISPPLTFAGLWITDRVMTALVVRIWKIRHRGEEWS